MKPSTVRRRGSAPTSDRQEALSFEAEVALAEKNAVKSVKPEVSSDLVKKVKAIAYEVPHGEPDREYLVTTGTVSDVKRTLEVREDAMANGDYLAGYTDENHIACKVKAGKTVFAQSEGEAVAIANGRALGIKRKNKVPERFEDYIVVERVKIPRELGDGGIVRYKCVPKLRRILVTATADDIADTARFVQWGNRDYKAQGIALKAEEVTDVTGVQADAMARHIAGNDKAIADARARLEYWKNYGDKLIIKGIIAELKDLGVKV